MSSEAAHTGIEEARKTLGQIADHAHNDGTITYLTRYGRSIAAVVPVGSRASAVPASIIDAAMDAAWPGLPDGITIDEARRRTVAALNAAQPHLADLLDQVAQQAVNEALTAARERIQDYGRDTGDMKTATAYARLLDEDWNLPATLSRIAEAAKKVGSP